MLFRPGYARFSPGPVSETSDWLQSKHTFLFGSSSTKAVADDDDNGNDSANAVVAPNHTSSTITSNKERFGQLRVLNEDKIAPGRGFDTHGHCDFEIFTLVLSGRIRHTDSFGNSRTCGRGDVQFTSAGTGIRHSEYNASETEPLHLLQVWIKPMQLGLSPRYDVKSFPLWERGNTQGKPCLILSPRSELSDTSITINADAFISVYAGNDRVDWLLKAKRKGFIHLISGKDVDVGDGRALLKEGGDAVEISDMSFNRVFTLAPSRTCDGSLSHFEVLLFDLGPEDDWDSMDVTQKFTAFVDAHHAMARAMTQNL